MDLLSAIEKEHRPTRIMYMTNLSWAPLKEYLYKLAEKDLIAERAEKTRRLYYLTEKGKNALKSIEHFKRETFPMEARVKPLER